MSEDMGIFKDIGGGIVKGIFKKGRFRGTERGTFIKDMDMGAGDLENGGGVVSVEGEIVEAEVTSLESVLEQVVIVGVVVEWAACGTMAD
jgi:hypothetical protein